MKQSGLPAIGLTPDWTVDDGASRYQLNRSYADAVLAAQGLPLVLPYSDDAKVIAGYLEAVDGLLITGGPFDVDPKEYGEERRPQCVPAKKERTAFERALLEHALERQLPVLGVCGGMQVLNVVLGGTLYQDIPTDVPEAIAHQQTGDKRRPVHAVSIELGTLLAQALAPGQLMVNSTHHQAVRQLGNNLSASARAPDGLIEGVEMAGAHFVVGVQWHPELLLVSVPVNLGIYRALVKAAAEARR